MSPTSTKGTSLHPRIRVVHEGQIALGPGKADLLDAISRTGSLASSAESVGMSYMRAWNLVRVMNASFREPLVALRRGGQTRGGATVTPAGKRVLERYRRMEERATRAVSADFGEIKKILR